MAALGYVDRGAPMHMGISGETHAFVDNAHVHWGTTVNVTPWPKARDPAAGGAWAAMRGWAERTGPGISATSVLL